MRANVKYTKNTKNNSITLNNIKVNKKRAKMFVHREPLRSTTIPSKCLLLVIPIVAFVLCSLCVCSYLETKYRLDTLEHQHQLLINEIKTIFGIGTDASKHLSGHQSEKQFHLVYLASSAKFITSKDATNQAIELNAYLDQSGRSDYALASAGARIISIGQTQLVNPPPSQWSTLFGASSQIESRNGPHHVLQPSIYPGECFAFVGRGEIHIKLVKPVYIDAVSVEHILPQMSPDTNIRNAPRDFTVDGFINSNDLNAIHFGTFRYDIDEKRPLQLFALSKNVTGHRFDSVRFVFLSNHGAANTCIYRIRVYGSLSPIQLN